MRPITDGVFLVPGFPPHAINAYLAGDVLIDAGTRFAAGRILRALRGRPVKGHALTHSHPDHQGSSRTICDALNIPLSCGAAEADAVSSGRINETGPDTRLARFATWLWAGPACPVARRLVEGDEVAGFLVLDVPGHSPGHVAYWRESDRTLILGDVLNNMSLLTGLPGLHEPPIPLTLDPALNRDSARKLAALGPELILFGHGPPLRDARRFAEFVARLA